MLHEAFHPIITTNYDIQKSKRILQQITIFGRKLNVKFEYNRTIPLYINFRLVSASKANFSANASREKKIG